MLGTPLYMSPEQFSGNQIDARCDIYSAGATYFHMLTGQAPYVECENLTRLMYAHFQGAVPDPQAVDPQLPAPCTEIVKRAMAKRPEDRYESAGDMAQAAVALLGELCDTESAALTDSTQGHGTIASQFSGSVVRASSVIRPPPTNIWLLEPSRMQARVLQQQLVELGVAQVQIFQTIAETMAGLADKVPQGIISAMNLDDGSGDDLAAQLKTHPAGATIPCFLIASKTADFGSGSHPGRPLVLQKPVTKEMLADVLRRVSASAAR
jgi:PleD family two-component response regulator